MSARGGAAVAAEIRGAQARNGFDQTLGVHQLQVGRAAVRRDLANATGARVGDVEATAAVECDTRGI
ncbi:MAG: hypothetical protein M1541_05220, partial [Acidobacteria bacterium]|nr:hypothetical protein [Acidobacteriota bacterium]